MFGMDPDQFDNPASMEQKKNPLFEVTPTSKYLAMLLFITMPFVGGYIGYTYAPVKVVEVEKLMKINQQVSREGVDDNFDGSVESWYVLQNLGVNCLHEESGICDHSLVKENILGQTQVVIENIHEIFREFKGTNINKPYIDEFYFPRDSNKLYFKSFIANSSGCCNIVAFDISTSKFEELDNGRYDPVLSGHVQSPDGSKIARLNNDGTQIEVVDILTDTFSVLVTSDSNETFIYQISLYGGDNVPDLTWRDESKIIYGVYRVINEDPLRYSTELIEYRVVETPES